MNAAPELASGRVLDDKTATGARPDGVGTQLASVGPLFYAMERYRRLVESSPDGILVVEDERIAFVNPAAVRLFGRTIPIDS